MLKIQIKEQTSLHKDFEPNKDDISKDIGTFDESVKKLLRALLVGQPLPVSIKGTPDQVSALKATLNAEADYISSYIFNSAESAETMRKKINLNVQIKEFERITNMKWPLK
jgi:hypothetical protein